MTLTERIQQGSEEGFAELYRAYCRRLYHFAWKSVGDRAEAEDITQAIFLKIWENRGRLSPDHPLESQVFRVARTVVIDYYRARTTHRQLLADYLQISAPDGPSSADDGPALQRERLLRLQSAIAEMPEKRREVFQLSRLHGLTYEEIADELSISKHTVHVHISKALAFLRRRLVSWLL